VRSLVEVPEISSGDLPGWLHGARGIFTQRAGYDSVEGPGLQTSPP
jgi:hypothetical protein